METSDCSISMIIPIKGKTIDVVNKKSKYIGDINNGKNRKNK